MKKLLKKLLLLLFNKGYKKREAEESLEKEIKIWFKEINNWPLKEKKSKKEAQEGHGHAAAVSAASA